MADKFDGMLLDINNNCNIRCRFCINDWTKPKKTVYMNETTYDKALGMLPLVKRGFMSCAFEPTIHPEWIKLFKKIPKTDAYTFITTNLSRLLTDKEIEELASTNLDAVTVSLTSLNKEVYEEFHAGSKFKNFINNLDRLSDALREPDKNVCCGREAKPDGPRLRFITVVFKQNLDEVVDMAKYCYERYEPILYQFRTVFQTTLKAKKPEWVDKSIPSKEEWNSVYNKLKSLPYKDVCFLNSLYPEPSTGKRQTSTFFSFRSNGTITFHENDKTRLPIEFRNDFNINDIDKPIEFFKTGLAKL